MYFKEKIAALVSEYSYPTVEAKFKLEPQTTKDWITGKSFPTEEELADIENKIDEFILSRDYRDCSGLLFLQNLLFPKPVEGNYSLSMTCLFSLNEVVRIYPRTFLIRDKSFQLLVCQVLSTHGLLKIERKGYDVYKITITKDGVAWLIRDWLKTSNSFFASDDDTSIDSYLSKVVIMDNEYA